MEAMLPKIPRNIRREKYFPVPYSGEYNPLEIFPAEIWSEILKRVNTGDLLSCIRATSIWSKQLPNHRKPSMYFHAVLPLLLPYIEKKDLLNCCEVNSTWCNAVDVCVDQCESFDLSHWNEPNPLGTLLCINTHVEVNDFHCSIPPVNYMLYRTCKLNIDGELQPMLMLKLNTFLANYGAHIRQLDATFANIPPNPGVFNEVIKILRNFIQVTGNLRTLRVTVRITRPDYLKPIGTLLYRSLPELPNFKRFAIYSNLPEVGHLVADKYGSQLETFIMHNSLPGLRGDIQWTKLQNLELTMHTCKDIDHLDTILLLRKLPLKSLCLYITCKLNSTFAQKLVPVVNDMDSELQELMLKCVGVEERKYNRRNGFSHITGLQLPNLTALTLGNTGFGYPPAAVLSGMTPKLKKLYLEIYGEKNVYNGGDVDAYENLYGDHEFWKGLPTLDSVRVQAIVVKNVDGDKASNHLITHSRDMYEYLKGQKIHVKFFYYVVFRVKRACRRAGVWIRNLFFR